ncbi:hypothetical protein AB0G95_36765 [Streptomyces virginiae]|uniref:hypothetical protein n=1 Tax=Streptomyces virginiae TaxID=1961 RepID=UPI00342C0805
MGQHPPLPPAARAAAEAACGPVELTEITDRRGSAVWKATGPDGHAAAVKVGYGDGLPVTTREGEVLRLLRRPDLLGAGTAAEASWLVTRWLDGPSTYKLFAPYRGGESGQEQALAAAVGLCRAVADLHAAGWIHSDLQPAHALHTPAGVQLIDLAWAWGPGFEPTNAFRGGIVHLLAPELAASINVGLTPITPSPAADVYALAGSLWTCVTGGWPLDYHAAGIDPHHLSPAQLRARISNRAAPLSPARPWPELQKPLRDVLLAPRSNRPTANELEDLLAAL